MGMAASQGRLLSMTARLSDLEFQSQSKCQSKIKLAMSTEDITREYTAALNKKKFVGLTGSENGSPVYSDLTYDMLTGINSPLAGDYCLTDSSNRILVTNDMKQKFDGKTLEEFLTAFKANTDTLVSPAVYPSGYDATTYPQAVEQLTAAVVAAQAKVDSTPPTIAQTDAEAAAAKQQAADKNQEVYYACLAAKHKIDIIASALNPKNGINNESAAVLGFKRIFPYNKFAAAVDTTTGKTMTEAQLISRCNAMIPEAKEKYEALKYDADSAWCVYQSLPSTGGASVPNPAYTAAVNEVNAAKQARGAIESSTPAVNSPAPEKTYYTNIYNRMAQGYTTQTDESKTINNKAWLGNQLNNKGLFLEKFDAKTGKTADQDLSGASELMEVRDKEDLDIIEAKYDADMLAIQTKDKRLDMEIKQIDTEHLALQTEVESVQKVIQKNIESSFKTFG